MSARAQGIAALSGGDAVRAATLLEAALAEAPGDAGAAYALAVAYRALADPRARDGAAAALRLAPGAPQPLVLVADLLAEAGETGAAARHYAAAVRAAGDPARLSPGLRADIARAAAAAAAHAGAKAAALEATLDQGGFDRATAPPRFTRALDILTGRARPYPQAPQRFLYPGLPATEWHEPGSWAAAVEEAAPAIRAELATAIDAPFAPYVEADAIRPGAGDGGMAGNAGWSALYLVREGARAPLASRFPATMAALAGVPLHDAAGTPSVLFSRLAPGARIPPHTGFVNTRLIAHLALTVPDGPWLRVGNDARPWTRDRVSLFDDTIEHEAANPSSQERTVLIFDVWRPDLSDAERVHIRALFAAAGLGGLGT